MNTWEDADLAALFATADELPASVRIDPAEHPARWLISGQIRGEHGPSRPVTSRVAMRGADGLYEPLLGHEAMIGADEAREALHAANAAWARGQGAWPGATFEERAAAVERFAERIDARSDVVATLLMWEIGKPWGSARDEVTRSVRYIRDTLSELRALRDEDRRVTTGVAGATTHRARTERRPLGRVLCVAPFNYPVNEFLTTVIPALLMGNVVIAKTPRFGVLANMALIDAFREAFPPGVVSLLPGDGRVVIPALMGATEPDLHGRPSALIDVLAFIGSEGAANAILKTHAVPITLHKVLGLGAKNLSAVLPGADLDAAAAALVKGALGFNGQRCTAEKLVFVHRSIAADLLDRLVARVEALRIGLPWDAGVGATPLPEPDKLASMRALLDDAVARGARVLNAGGGRGTFSVMRPAVVYPVGEGMRLFHEEQFGPLLAVAPFDDVAEVIAWQHRSPYGQQAAVWGPADAVAPLVRALAHSVARVNVNDVCQRGPDAFGFTATDKSGFGTLSLREALLTFSRPVLIQSPDPEALDRCTMG
jgi:glyceraldehyde-3-phosphate dehydrogenase (NADP+)